MCAGRIRSVISARVFAAFIGGAVLFAFPASATTVTDPNILKGSVSGETLTIQGTNLGTNKPTVQLGGAGLTVQSFSPTQVVATMPPEAFLPGLISCSSRGPTGPPPSSI